VTKPTVSGSIDPHDPRLPDDAALDATMDVDRAFFAAHLDRKHYVRHARPDELSLRDISYDLDTDRTTARKLANRYMRYRGKNGEPMHNLVVVRQLCRLKTGEPGTGVRMRAWLIGLECCCDAGEEEARFIWDECNKDRTMGGIPVPEVIRKLEREYAKLDV
jgi:hypothetical protein